jgi:hypothetical protein
MWGLGLGMGLWLFLNDRFTWGEVGIEALHFRRVTGLRTGKYAAYIAHGHSRGRQKLRCEEFIQFLAIPNS